MSTNEPNSQTLANSLVERLHSDIAAKDLREGDFFMTGDQVAEHYAVSRGVAREALSQLRALGVLKSRQRKGLLVGRPDPVAIMARWIPVYCRDGKGEGLASLAQLRYVLEMGAVDLVVPNAGQDQIAQLAQIAHDFEAIAAIHGHNEEADQVDLSYHCLILEMTGNPLVSGMHRVVSDYFLASTQAAPSPSEDPAAAIREHHMIADAISRQDAELVRTLLRAHLAKTLDV
jgi:GntR family transcriptional regulator, transcriptional repressor for pyruvate dehydrogenase complex